MMDEGYIQVLGQFTMLAPAEWWNQSERAISLARRLAANEVTEAEIIEALSNVQASYVVVAAGTTKRCVDGRSRQGYKDSDSTEFTKPLGPQIQGGTADEAIIQRVIKGYEPDATFLADIDAVADQQSDYKPGDHTDDHADQTKTGCGAIDGQTRKWDMLQDPEKRQAIDAATKAVMEAGGLIYAAEKSQRYYEVATQLSEHKDAYLPAPQAVLERLRQHNADAVEQLEGAHKEIMAVLNFVPNTTLHTSHFASLTAGKVQAFGLDVWAIVTEYGDDTQYILQDTVQTLLDLTDGSLLAVARLPRAADMQLPDLTSSVKQLALVSK